MVVLPPPEGPIIATISPGARPKRAVLNNIHVLTTPADVERDVIEQHRSGRVCCHDATRRHGISRFPSARTRPLDK